MLRCYDCRTEEVIDCEIHELHHTRSIKFNGTKGLQARVNQKTTLWCDLCWKNYMDVEDAQEKGA